MIVSSQLSPREQPQRCLSGMDHTSPEVPLESFDVQLDGAVAGLLGNLAEGAVGKTLKRRVAAKADELLSRELESIVVFDQTQKMNLLGSDVDVRLCLTDLESSQVLRAIIGAEAEGPSGRGDEGDPLVFGAPLVQGGLPPPTEKTLLLDSNMISQLLFSSWRAGDFNTQGFAEIDLGDELDLGDLVSPEAKITMDTEVQLPPVVRSNAGGENDLVLEFGDLHLLLRVGDQLLFRIGTRLSLYLDLVPQGTALRPEVARVQADVFVLEEPLRDVDDALLEQVVGDQLQASAQSLLRDIVIPLPVIGAPLVPTEVLPHAEGRYVSITYQ